MVRLGFNFIPGVLVLKITCCEMDFFNDKGLFLRDQKVWIFDFEIVAIKSSTYAWVREPTFKKSFRNHSWYKHHMAPVRWVWREVQVNGRDTVRRSTDFGSWVGIYLFYSFFLQIYKLRGSYIKECKNHFRNSKILNLIQWNFRNSGFLGVSCMICSGLNRFK